MGKIKINETASEPIDMKKGSNTNEEPAELIMPIEHYVTVSAKVENPEAGVSVEGVKSAPRKKATTTKTTSAAGRKKALALPAGSIGAAVIDEKEKAANASGKDAKKAAKVAAGAEMVGAAGVKASAKKASMDGMVKPKARTVEVTEIETTAEEEFEAHRPREKKDDESEEEENPRFSKPKALLIGVGVTLAVALVGGLVIGLLGHKDVPRCIVQFESNGGSKIENEEVVCGETVGRPSDPTKDGFAFQSWIYGGAPFDFDRTTIDEDMVLVAKWQVEDGVETVKVKFDTAGGSDIDEVEVKKGGVISEPVEPTRTSYEFVGWKLNGEDFDFSQPIEENVTLVAEWKPIAGGQSSGGSSTPSTPEKPRVESLAVADASMKVGETKRFDVTIKPSNADVKLGVSSSNQGVATCNVVEDNRLQCEAKAPGETTIRLRDTLTGKDTQFKLTVTAETTFVSLMPTTVSLSYIGATTTLKATVSPDNATNKQLTWTSSNPSVIEVDANGTLKAVGYGNATITVKTVNGMEASCLVTGPVKQTTPVNPPVVDPDPKPGPEEPGPTQGPEA